MNIALATISTNIKDYSEITIKNKQQYCEQHGYKLNYKSEDFACKNIGFAKIAYILDLLPNYDWIFWLGEDTMITNFTIKLEDLIDERYELIIANNVWGMDTNSFLIKNSPTSKMYFEHVYRSYNRYIDEDGKPKDTLKKLPDGSKVCWCEQEAMIDLKPKYKKIFKFVPQKILNSYCYWLYSNPWYRHGQDVLGNDGTWSKGDFIVHLAGLSIMLRIALAHRFIDNVVK